MAPSMDSDSGPALEVGSRLLFYDQGVLTAFDLKKGEWLIPKERAKNKRECLLPLSEAALAIVEGRDHAGAHLFPRTGKGGHLRARGENNVVDPVSNVPAHCECTARYPER